MASTRAFISYAHDSAEHRDQVRRLWTLLRQNGVDAWCDLDVAGARREWARLIEEMMGVADHILVVASPEYLRRSAADRPFGEPEGRGVAYEVGLIRELIYGDRASFERVVPVLLPGGSKRHVPRFLLPASAAIYEVSDFTVNGAVDLLRLLTRQPGVLRPTLGPRPLLPPHESRAVIEDELVRRLAELPEMATPAARAHFLEMISIRLPAPIDVTDEGEPLPRMLVSRLSGIPGGLGVLAATVHLLHRAQPIEVVVSQLVAKLAITESDRPH